ncbi:DUF6402 family protein [Variovorax sp. E3]|uniref:DUF6402 family protein n=1 Tax=Variovorax sp. E3 TaxID=1914993 RepID=UPI0018DD5155|nr:DUF6402 family protein [Variovorax sp. E3]
MQSQAGGKVDFHKSSNFMRSWAPQAGEICGEGIALSMNRAPPLAQGRTGVEGRGRKSMEVPSRRQSKEDSYAGAVLGAIKVAESMSGAVGRFQQWLKSPPPAPADKTEPAKTVPPFDIQDIPGAMRKLGAPLGAQLMDKWFAGPLNYSPTSGDERNGINQNGVPYPPSMIDTTSVKIDWVLRFERARKGLDFLMSQLETPPALKIAANALRPYRNRRDIWPWLECKGDIPSFHKAFQFQLAPVEGTLSQKLAQFVTQSLFNEGAPDDLTCVLGSFNLYAAISYAYFDHKNKAAVVTHVSVYVKDNFTFTDKKGEASQYLGHWSRSHVAIVPVHEAAALANIGWVGYPVVQGDVHAKDAVLYPVRNSDFRAWQRKHNQGGDFVIYTDRFTMKLDTPIRVAL